MCVERGHPADTSTLSPQLLQELRDPTLTFRLLGSPRYGGGEMNRGIGGAAGVQRRFLRLVLPWPRTASHALLLSSLLRLRLHRDSWQPWPTSWGGSSMLLCPFIYPSCWECEPPGLLSCCCCQSVPPCGPSWSPFSLLSYYAVGRASLGGDSLLPCESQVIKSGH